MLGPKKKSTNRLSSLFVGSADSHDTTPAKAPSPVPSQSTGKLTKVKQRVASVTRLAPDYPPPPPPKPTDEASLSNPTIQPVEPAGLGVAGPSQISQASASTLEVPPSALDIPSLKNPQSRSSSRPGTPNGDASPDGHLRKARRRSRLFGGSLSGERPNVNSEAGRHDPLAWIVGHQGKVPYNLTMLLNGEHVSRQTPYWTLPKMLTNWEGTRALG